MTKHCPPFSPKYEIGQHVQIARMGFNGGPPYGIVVGTMVGNCYLITQDVTGESFISFDTEMMPA